MASAYIQIIRILIQKDNYEKVGNPCSLFFMYKSLLEAIILKWEKLHRKPVNLTNVEKTLATIHILTIVSAFPFFTVCVTLSKTVIPSGHHMEMMIIPIS